MLSEDELSLKYYQDGGFYFINLFLREHKNNLDEKEHKNNLDEKEQQIVKHINNIDNLFIKKSHNLIVFRGVNNNKIFDGVNYGFVSTSTNLNIAKKFAGKNGIVYELRIDDDILYLDKNMWNNLECEILLPRNLIFNVINTIKKQNNLYCIMKVSKI